MRKAFSEKNVAIVLFLFVVILFSVAERDTQKAVRAHEQHKTDVVKKSADSGKIILASR